MQTTYIDVLKELSNILINEFPKLDIRITPWQVIAGEGYDKLANRTQILLNLGSVIYSPREIGSTIANEQRAGIYDVNANIQISIGKTNLNDNDDFEIENICKTIVDLFHFKAVSIGTLEFMSLSNGVIDANLNYWRHLRFTINSQKNTGIH